METTRFKPRLRLVRGGLLNKTEAHAPTPKGTLGFDLPEGAEAFGPFTRLGLRERFPSFADNKLLQLQLFAKVALLVALIYFLWR